MSKLIRKDKVRGNQGKFSGCIVTELDHTPPHGTYPRIEIILETQKPIMPIKLQIKEWPDD